MTKEFNIREKITEAVKSIQLLIPTSSLEICVKSVDNLIGLLSKRDYNKDRLFRKLFEEIGEYAEAIEFDNGAKRKVIKFKEKNSKKMLKEEISDVVMISLILARLENLMVEDVLRNIESKLFKYEQEYLTEK